MTPSRRSTNDAFGVSHSPHLLPRRRTTFLMFHAVVMAGGSGTRFWPKSRRNRPKQLLNLSGEGSMIQQTVARLGDLAPPGRIRVITGADQADAVREQLPQIPPGNVVAEP